VLAKNSATNYDTLWVTPAAGGGGGFLTGTGAPGSGVGNNGDVYLDLATLEMWGPKAAGAWPGVAFAKLVPTYVIGQDVV
jgi:hypothetical protein